MNEHEIALVMLAIGLAALGMAIWFLGGRESNAAWQKRMVKAITRSGAQNIAYSPGEPHVFFTNPPNGTYLLERKEGVKDGDAFVITKIGDDIGAVTAATNFYRKRGES